MSKKKSEQSESRDREDSGGVAVCDGPPPMIEQDESAVAPPAATPLDHALELLGEQAKDDSAYAAANDLAACAIYMRVLRAWPDEAANPRDFAQVLKDFGITREQVLRDVELVRSVGEWSAQHERIAETHRLQREATAALIELRSLQRKQMQDAIHRHGVAECAHRQALGAADRLRKLQAERPWLFTVDADGIPRLRA